MKGKHVSKEGPNDWMLHQSKPICWIASAIFNKKSKKYKPIDYSKHNIESKSQDDERLVQVNTSTLMNYQPKPSPFFNLQYDDQVFKNFEKKPRIKTKLDKDQITANLQPSSFSNTNVSTMHHQDKPTPLFKNPSHIIKYHPNVFMSSNLPKGHSIKINGFSKEEFKEVFSLYLMKKLQFLSLHLI